jgi:hypothetical protein
MKKGKLELLFIIYNVLTYYYVMISVLVLLLSIQPKLPLHYKIINSANIKKTKPISILAYFFDIGRVDDFIITHYKIKFYG